MRHNSMHNLVRAPSVILSEGCGGVCQSQTVRSRRRTGYEGMSRRGAEAEERGRNRGVGRRDPAGNNSFPGEYFICLC